MIKKELSEILLNHSTQSQHSADMEEKPSVFFFHLACVSSLALHCFSRVIFFCTQEKQLYKKKKVHLLKMMVILKKAPIRDREEYGKN